MNREGAYEYFSDKLDMFSIGRNLPGIGIDAARNCLIKQLVDSYRRVLFIDKIKSLDLEERVALPNSIYFNPIKAAIYHVRQKNYDEAGWIVFLITHFGKNRASNWELLRRVYGGLVEGNEWKWERICSEIELFVDWLDGCKEIIEQNVGFGPHRPYESLKARTANGTGSVISSYVDLVLHHKSHEQWRCMLIDVYGENKGMAFDAVYNEILKVRRFARLAAFDYCAMLGKIGVFEVEPGSVYLHGATGPKRGARLLLTSTANEMRDREMEIELNIFGSILKLPFANQIIEDAICNWQKSPTDYTYFGG